MSSNNKNRENAAHALLRLSEHPAWSPPPRIKSTPQTPSGENKVWVQTPSQGSYGEGRYGWISPAPMLSLEGKSRKSRKNRKAARKSRKANRRASRRASRR
jgi:hypothetical protein